MAGHFQHLKLRVQKISRRRLFDEEIRRHGFDLQFKSEVPKKIWIGDHWRSYRMAAELATKLSFHCGNVLDVIDMAVGQEKQLQIDITATDPIASALWRVEQDPAFGCGDQIAVRLKNPAAKRLKSHFDRS